MSVLPELARYVRPETRLVSAGVGPARVFELLGVIPVATIDPEAPQGEPATGDVFVTAPSALSPLLMETVRSVLAPQGVLVVLCAARPGDRLLGSPEIREVIRTLGASGFSILSPSRWLVPASTDSVCVVARHDGYVLRDYAPGDEAQILDLFEKSFGPRRPVEHWRWEYEANPNGNRAISLAFDAAGRLVAQYAGYPVALWSKDATAPLLMANQIGDTMTARDVRAVGRGPTSLVVRTAKHFFASHCEGRVAFNYGFNTANIRKISSSFNESGPVEPVPYRRAAFADLKRPGLALWLRRLRRRWTVRREAVVGPEWDRFFEEAAPGYGFLVRRDAAHVRWRYLESPVWQYELVTLRSAGRLVGWSVFRRVGASLVWGDALFAREHASGAAFALRHALRSPLASGAEEVVAWFPPRPAWWARTLLDLGLETSPEPNDLSFMCTGFDPPDIADRLRDRFYYAACDSDLY